MANNDSYLWHLLWDRVVALSGLAQGQQFSGSHLSVALPVEAGRASYDHFATAPGVLASPSDVRVALPDAPAKAGSVFTFASTPETSRNVLALHTVGFSAFARAADKTGAKNPKTEEIGEQGNAYLTSGLDGLPHVREVDKITSPSAIGKRVGQELDHVNFFQDKQKETVEAAAANNFSATSIGYVNEASPKFSEKADSRVVDNPILESDLPREPHALVDQDRAYYQLIDNIVAKKPGAIREFKEKYQIPDIGMRTLLEKYGIENAPEEVVGSGETLEYIPLDATFLLHSNPGATKTIYLDFDGFTATGTSWNSSYGDPIISPAYDPSGNGASFTTSELERIQRIHARVSEDFAGFDVNVTTEDPGEAALVNTGSGDNEWGIRVVVTVDDFANCGCGGFAYINSFNWNYQSEGASDTPTYVFNTSEIGVAAATSHEVGHTLGLSHDGTTTANPIQPDAAYYNGHGSGETGWGPIMGSGYYKNVTTWDRGEYFGASNGGSDANYNRGPDDIEIITTYNGFGFRADDHGNDSGTATEVNYDGPNMSDPSLVDVSLYGVIEDQLDRDFFRFDTGTGNINLSVNSYVDLAYVSNEDGTFSSSLTDTFYSTSWQNNQGSNLDVDLQLYDSFGNLVATSNPVGLSASLTLQADAGTYFLSIDGTGYGDPTLNPPTGYTDYASTGQYFLSGTVAPAGLKLSAVADSADKAEGNSGSTPFTFNITMSEAQAEAVTVNWKVIDIGGADASDFTGGQLPEGLVTFNPGVTSIQITVGVNGDFEVEPDEDFAVELSLPTAGEVFAGAVGTIRADDAELRGRVWNDQNADGAVNAGEVGLSGVTVFLDANDNGVLDTGETSTSTNGSGDYSFLVAPGTYRIATDLTPDQTQTFPNGYNSAIEPDDYAAGSLLNSVDAYATLSGDGINVANNNVTATSTAYTSTGSLSFGSSWNGGVWNTTDAELRVDFVSPATEVSIDFISDDASDFGHLRAFSSTDELLDEYVTSDLGTGVVETMTISRNSSDISYVLASGRNGQFGFLDNLQFSGDGTGSAVSIEVTVGAIVSDNHDFGVHVSTPNDPPIANDDTASTNEDNSVTVSVLANDTDPNLDPLTVQAVTQGTNGSVTFTGSDVTYSPDVNFNGSDTFIYTVGDGKGGSDTATVSVTINPMNDAPNAVDDDATTNVGEAVTINVLLNDTDVDGDTLDLQSWQQPTSGSVEASGSQLVYTPDAMFAGTDTFTYVATDNAGGTAQATVTVTVAQPPGGITVSPTTLITQEGGSAVTFTVTLDTTPTETVTIPIFSSDETEGTVNVPEVVFVAGSSGSQTVTITPVDDLLVDGNVTYSIITGSAISADASYNNLDASDVSVTNEDNDTPIDENVYADETFSEGLIIGSVDGTISDTYVLDSNKQTLTEDDLQVGGSSKKPKLGSALEYLWLFSGLTEATSFHLVAQQSSNADDNFRFEYSSNSGTTWTPLGTINQTSPQTIDVTGLSLSGNNLVRVIDTDRSSANGNASPILDSVLIDEMYFNSTITDLRESVTIVASDPSAAENDPTDKGIFTVTRTSPTGETSTNGDLDVFYTLSENSNAATPGVDYTALSGEVTIPDGAFSATINVVAINDEDPEGPEHVTVNLTSSEAYAYKVNGSGSATVNIVDDDLSTYVANSENTIAGTVIENDYLVTHEVDGVAETIEERQSGGKPANRTSFLEHNWTFDNVTGAKSFTLVAKREDFEGDDFAFEYYDGADWRPLVTVAKSTFDTYTANLSAPTDGIISVRVKDTDPNTAGNNAKAILSVDYMSFSTASLTEVSTGLLTAESYNHSDQTLEQELSAIFTVDN